MPEFKGQALEALRQPLETGRVSIARANAHVVYPARFQLVAAMNPCRCGFLADPDSACSRAPKCGQDYQSKISGPLMDRMDIVVDVAAVSPADLSLPPPGEGSADVALRVAAARCRQRTRAEALAPGTPVTNAVVDGQALEKIAGPDDAGRKLMTDAVAAFGLSARGYHRVLRVARTIADLEGAANITRTHIAEALSYRRISPGRDNAHMRQPA